MTNNQKPRPPRGLAAMSAERRRQIASLGGKASSGNFAADRERAATVGRLGGSAGKGKKRDHA
jgi:general stress protein YciG